MRLTNLLSQALVLIFSLSAVLAQADYKLRQSSRFIREIFAPMTREHIVFPDYRPAAIESRRGTGRLQLSTRRIALTPPPASG